MAFDLQPLRDAVGNIEAAADRAEALLDGVHARIREAINEALAGGATVAQLEPITDFIATLRRETAELNTASDGAGS